MAWTDDPRIRRARSRSRLVDIVVETLEGFSAHLTGRNAAVLTYYGFLTLFPLLLAATTVLGFVLDSRPKLRQDIVDSALSQVPMIGNSVGSASEGISGNWWALLIGLGTALWGSLKAFVGIQTAYDDAWEVPLDGRANAAVKRLRALVGVAVIGASQVGTVALAAVVSTAGLPSIGQVFIVLGGIAINLAVVGTMYRFLTSAQVTWRQVVAGTVLTALVYTALQFAGTAIAARTLDSASAYGNFAATLVVLSWLSLHATVNLVGAELNGALTRRRGRVGPLPSEEAAAAIKHGAHAGGRLSASRDPDDADDGQA